MGSFDVKSLFAKDSLDITIEIEMILDKNLQQKKLTIPITKQDMKELLELCTKYVYFMFNIQQQNLVFK